MNPVVIVEYERVWPSVFETERVRIQGALGDQLAAVEHVGSTSVEWLAARPIIDILVALWVADFPPSPALRARLEGIGYGEALGIDPRHAIYKKDQPRVNVHLYWVGDSDAADLVIFRDYLRATRARAQEYELHKRRLAADHNDSGSYTGAKKSFVRETVDMARRAGFDWTVVPAHDKSKSDPYTAD